MLATKPSRRQARHLRWIDSLSDQHPDWLRLDQLLPSDHRARLIDRVVDSLDLLPLLPDFCAGFGSASWHPSLFLKLILYELDRGVLSPATWSSDCREHTPVMWLLCGAQPCRTALYEARNRFSPELLEQLNQQVLQHARAESFCSAKRASLDGTFVAAKGSRHQMLKLSRLEKRLILLEQAISADNEVSNDCGGTLSSNRPRWMAKSPQGRKNQQKKYQVAREHLEAKIARRKQRRASRAKGKHKAAEQAVICVTEPEAVIGKDKFKVYRPLYNVQLMRDLDSPFLLSYGVFPAATDAGLLPEMLNRTKRLAGTLPKEVLADGIYTSVTDLQACAKEHVTLYAPVKVATSVTVKEKATTRIEQAAPAAQATAVVEERATTTGPGRSETKRQPLPMAEAKGANGVKKYYGRERFVWDAKTSSYTCPANEHMKRVDRRWEKRENGGAREVERYGTKACGNCEKREECTPSKTGRKIKRMVDEPQVEALRERMASESGKALYKKRKETIEREFADIKEHRGMTRFTGYGPRQAETQVGLLFLLANGKSLTRLRQAATRAA